MQVTRRHFFLGSLALPVFAGKKAAAVKPNLVLILVEDLPSWALGCYGNKEIRTPNIDRLAQTGTRFLNHFACAPAAGPGRATLFTGLTPMQLGQSGAAASGAGLPKILADAGYAVHADEGQAGLKFLDQQAPGKPFFLTVNCTSLRPPYDATPQKYRDLYASEPFNGYRTEAPRPDAQAGKEMLADIIGSLRKCAAAITALDDDVAALLTKLFQKHLIDNTLIVLAGTNGSLLGRHGLWDSGDATDPPNMYDEVIGTPMLWSWPGRVPAQATQVELVSSYDFLPSICEAAGLAAPGGKLCGRSYLVFAAGKTLPKKQKWRSAVCGSYKGTDMARIERYKLVIRDGGKGPNELYDLGSDPRENANQADNDAFATIRTSLAAEITKWKGQYSA